MMVDNIYYLIIYLCHYKLHELLLILRQVILNSQCQFVNNTFLYF